MASVDKRPDGKWRARWREYPGGPQRTKHFARKVDAEQWLVKVQHQLATNTYVTPEQAQVSFGTYVETHLTRQPWRSATKDIARNALDHALDFFGKDRPLSSIRKADVQAYVAGLHLAPSSVRTLHQHLNTLMVAAVDDRLVLVNPAAGVRLPRSERSEVIPPSAEVVEAVLDAIPDWFRPAVVLGVGLGLRQAEASGLTSDRVLWLERAVRIDRQWVTRRLPGGFQPPKSESSFRTVPAAVWVLEELSQVATPSTTFLVREHDDVPTDHNRFNHVWHQALRRAGVETFRFHALRHRFASALLSGGCSIVAVQRAMGHSLPSVTLNLYGHLMPSDDDRVRHAIGSSFRHAEDSVRTAGTLREA